MRSFEVFLFCVLKLDIASPHNPTLPCPETLVNLSENPAIFPQFWGRSGVQNRILDLGEEEKGKNRTPAEVRPLTGYAAQ